ncbi:Uric acid degradation bifunctional protein TTL [Arachis hypogaea]|uniref:2-oxo-4-hydroxy-4-carboxy-5-ureidoimidazoline decarboxylase n=1 Tax=Arachis hypogaea TaxID=3818 RepID=A0A6B9V2Z6_ARAHY|nr:Uric acid degradation bifunctional protein TTL [Arachis hypogaea]
MKDFSSCCASTTFAKEMAMASPFSSLEHAISVAREIWFRKLNVWCWLEAISGRSCFNEYLEMANESTMQELYEWGSMYEKKFGYVFVTCASGKSSEDVLTELKLFSKESSQTVNKGDVLAEYSGEVVNDTLDGADIDSADNLDKISSTGTNMSMQFDLNKVSEEDNKTSDDQQVEDGVHVAKQRFNLNKKQWFGDDLSHPVSREASRFLTEFFWPGEYDVDEKN